MTKAVTIEPIEDRHLEQFQAVIDSVSREREFLGTVEGFPLEQTRQFVESIRGGWRCAACRPQRRCGGRLVRHSA